MSLQSPAGCTECLRDSELRVQIGPELRKLCEKLGLEYTGLAELVIDPDKVVARIYEKTSAGCHILDASTGGPRYIDREIKVCTEGGSNGSR